MVGVLGGGERGGGGAPFPRAAGPVLDLCCHGKAAKGLTGLRFSDPSKRMHPVLVLEWVGALLTWLMVALKVKAVVLSLVKTLKGLWQPIFCSRVSGRCVSAQSQKKVKQRRGAV